MRRYTVTSKGIVLPNATDTVSIASYIGSTISFCIGMISLARPSIFGASADIAIQATVPLVSIGTALGIGILNAWRHSSARRTAIASGENVFVTTKQEYLAYYGQPDGLVKQKAEAKLSKIRGKNS